MALDVDEVNSDNRRLAIGALIAEEMRAAVYKDTGFRCSAGIAHNKVTVTFYNRSSNKTSYGIYNSVTGYVLFHFVITDAG